MQEFYKNTLQSKLIQNILLNTPLPIFKTISDYDYIVKNQFYIYKSDVIKCTESGYFKSLTDSNRADYDVISNYKFGDWVPKLTDRFITVNNYYDGSTHERLGNYLRCVRDIYGLDLMSMYNCFAQNYSAHTSIDFSTGTPEVVNTATDSFKVARIPIRYNQKYTIYLDCGSKVYMASALLVKDNLMTNTLTSIGSNKTAVLNQNTSNIKTLANMFYNQSVVYECTMPTAYEEELARYEHQLYLLIQIPLKNTSTLTVLEGDYKNIPNMVYMSGDYDISDKAVNKYCLHNISLALINSEVNFPYSPRLIEYLLLNPVSNLDHLYNNVTRIQEIIGLDEAYHDKSVWTNRLRYILYRRYLLEYANRKMDVTGCVDKDLESYINWLEILNGR